MTVKLLSAWGTQPPGTLYTSDAATEAAMVTAKVATATLTGAVAWVPNTGSPPSSADVLFDLASLQMKANGAAVAGGPVSVSGYTGLGAVATAVVAPGWSYTGIQWKRNTSGSIADIAGATTAAYIQQAADVVPGVSIYPLVTGLSFGPVGIAAATVSSAAPTVTAAPVVMEPVVVGAAATFTAATFSDGQPAANTQFSLAGADAGSTYTPTLADSNKIIRVRQTAAVGSPTATSVPSFVGWQNWKASNTVAARAMMAGGVRGRILVLGDSYPAGYGANNNGYVGARTKSFPSQLASLLTAAGRAASSSFACGTGMNNAAGLTQDGTTMNTLDPRIVMSGGAVPLAGFESLGGRMLKVVGGAAQKWTFTPGNTFDTVELQFAVAAAGAGSFRVSVDGGTTAVTSVTDAGANGVGRATVSVPPGSTSVTIYPGAAETGSNVNCVTMIGTRTAAAPGIEVMNAGATGVKLQAVAAAPTTTADINTWNTRACIPGLLDANAQNLTIINGWYNDQTAGRTLSQIQADLTTLVTQCKAYGDVAYINYAALDTAAISQVNFRSFSDGMIATAVGLDIPVIDTSRQITNYAGNMSLYYDNLHLQEGGAAYPAGSIAARLLASMT